MTIFHCISLYLNVVFLWHYLTIDAWLYGILIVHSLIKKLWITWSSIHKFVGKGETYQDNNSLLWLSVYQSFAPHIDFCPGMKEGGGKRRERERELERDRERTTTRKRVKSAPTYKRPTPPPQNPLNPLHLPPSLKLLQPPWKIFD